MIEIRRETEQDYDTVRAINRAAFGQASEGEVIDKLRSACDDLISLVAVVGNQVVGHVMFSPVTIEGKHGVIQGMGIAPMAVEPKYQGQGVGTKLLEHGLEILKKSSCPFLVVLGHKKYYPRFGFKKANKYSIQCAWDSIPKSAFMILILDKKIMKGVKGVARYRKEFDEII